jgi:hypothetical protein
MATFQTITQIPDGQAPGSFLAANADVQPAQLAQRVLQGFPVALTSARQWDAMATNLPATAATDDLGLVTGTPGTNAPKITTGDVKALGPTSRKLAFELPVPANYEDGQTIQLVVRTGMETTVADVSATVDVEAWKPNGSGGVGSDLITTSALTTNSLTPSDKTFVIDGSALLKGEKLICVVTFAVNDAATATAVIGAIYSIDFKCDTRG